MDWGARLRAAWHGEVSNADLAAMFAATARLSDLKQALADRRLVAEIEHVDHEWRVLLAVGSIAAPFWLADALVALAGAFYDAETPTGMDHPSTINAYTHDLIANLLAPIEDIIADVTAALADPSHRTALTAPLRVAPGGQIAGERLPGAPSIPYVRGLATGARRIHTTAAAALADARAIVAKSEAPDWLGAGLRRLDGELQAAGARLDVAELRLTPLLRERGAGDAAVLAGVCRDLWTVVDTAVVAGQLIADPHLLPEAQTLPQHAAQMADAAVWAAPPPVPPQPRPARHAQPMALPQIAEGAPSAQERRETSSAAERQPTPPDLALPIVGGQDATPQPSTPEPPGRVSLPTIGESSQSSHSSAAELPHRPTPDAAPSAPSRQRNEQPEQGDEPAMRFPDIG